MACAGKHASQRSLTPKTRVYRPLAYWIAVGTNKKYQNASGAPRTFPLIPATILR